MPVPLEVGDRVIISSPSSKFDGVPGVVVEVGDDYSFVQPDYYPDGTPKGRPWKFSTVRVIRWRVDFVDSILLTKARPT